MVLVYAIAHTSGGQLKWAVTIGLMVSGDLNRYKDAQICLLNCSEVSSVLLCFLPPFQKTWERILAPMKLIAMTVTPQEPRSLPNSFSASCSFLSSSKPPLNREPLLDQTTAHVPLPHPLPLDSQSSLPIFSSSQSPAAQSILLDHSDQL